MIRKLRKYIFWLLQFGVVGIVHAQTQTAQFYTEFQFSAPGNYAQSLLPPEVDTVVVAAKGFGVTSYYTLQIVTSNDGTNFTSCGTYAIVAAGALASATCSPSGASYIRVSLTGGAGNGTAAIIGNSSFVSNVGAIPLGSAGFIPVMNVSGTAYAPVAMSGDATINSSGVVTAGANIARLGGVVGGQTFSGGTGASDNLTLEGTSNATKTTNYVLMNPLDANAGACLGCSLPGSWNNVIAIGNSGTNFQIHNSEAARLIIDSGGNTGHLAEMHFINESAPANSRTMRFTNTAAGHMVIDACSDNYSTCLSALDITPVSGAVTLAGHLNLTQAGTPMASSCGGGTVATGSTDNSFAVTGIAAATTCTVTFNAAINNGFCVASSNSTSQNIAITAVSKTAVTFGMTAAFTGTIYSMCL